MAADLYVAEQRRRGDWQWAAFDFRMRRARDCAVRDRDSHLLGACLELQANRWEIAGYQGEVLSALGGALAAYERIAVPSHQVLHCDRIKQRIDNWYQVPRVFVSYARRQRRRVERVVDYLQTRRPTHAQVLWDATMFVPGVDLSLLIRWALGHVADPERHEVRSLVTDALRVAGVYLVMWSRIYASRPWTMWELDCAVEYVGELRAQGLVGPRVVVARLDDHPIPRALRDYLWIELSRGLDDAGRDQLWRAVTHTELLGPRLPATRRRGPAPLHRARS